MTFTHDQIKLLEAPLSRDAVKQRSQSGRSLSYIEGWHAIAEANRIFGFDKWSRTTVDLRMVNESKRTIGQQKAEGWGVTYIARVQINVGAISREGIGSGHGIDRDLGQAHESAVKEAETDAMKRALMTFGNQFGLALYDKEQRGVDDGNGDADNATPEPSRASQRGARPSQGPKQPSLLDTAEKVAGKGLAQLADWWSSLVPADQKALEGEKLRLKGVAEEADKERAHMKGE